MAGPADVLTYPMMHTAAGMVVPLAPGVPTHLLAAHMPVAHLPAAPLAPLSQVCARACPVASNNAVWDTQLQRWRPRLHPTLVDPPRVGWKCDICAALLPSVLDLGCHIRGHFLVAPPAATDEGRHGMLVCG